MNDIQKLKDYLDVELDSHEVALESFLGKVFPRLDDKIRNIYQKLAGYDNKKRITSNRNRFLKIVDSIDYAGIRTMNVQVPMGFIGKTVNATALLNEMIAHAETLEKEVLIPVNKYLANLIVEPIKKNDAKEAFKVVFERKKTREKLGSQMGEMYSAADKSQVPLAQILDRNSDWKIILDNLETAQRFFNFDIKNMRSKVDSILSYINTVVEMIDEGLIANTQKDVVISLSEGIFAVAEEVTFISQIFYWLSSQIEATDKNMQEFIKKFG